MNAIADEGLMPVKSGEAVEEAYVKMNWLEAHLRKTLRKAWEVELAGDAILGEEKENEMYAMVTRKVSEVMNSPTYGSIWEVMTKRRLERLRKAQEEAQ